jgi:hypothetical protein
MGIIQERGGDRLLLINELCYHVYSGSISKSKSLIEGNTKMDEPSFRGGFGKALNIHGYGFQYSVLELANKLFQKNRSRLVFEAAEFPVQVQGEGTRIDFILRLNSYLPIYLLAECKRANPALSNWCFARVPYIRRNRKNFEPLLIESVQTDQNGSLYACAQKGHNLQDAYHIALEIKSSEKGDPHSSGRGKIEEAATQICRGLNGFVEFVKANKQILDNQAIAYFFPVIFTTAKVWGSDVDLAAAGIETGNVDFDKVNLDQKPWVFYQYHLSPNIKHSNSPLERPKTSPKTIGEFLDSEYIRTIAIVTSSGIEQFLSWCSTLDDYLT